MKDILYLFTDSSVNPQTKIAYGSYVYLSEKQINTNDIHSLIKNKRFIDTSSTLAELQILLFALQEKDLSEYKLVIYTDCQNIIGLNNRREGFEKSNYFSKTNKRIKNHLFYKEFFILNDKIDCTFIKIKGHKKTVLKDSIDRVFSLVDKNARLALRNEFSVENINNK